MEKLSVVIITYNEQKKIGRCIDSVKSIADEVVVLDSNSTDQTVALAKERGALVYQQAFAGYIEQKNKALALATHPLVLSLDADEAIDDQLSASIEAIKAGPGAREKGYIMNRCTNYCGKFIRHGTWYPDAKLRLFDRTKASWTGINPHDQVVFSTPHPTTKIKGDILHYSYDSLEEHITQNNKFSTISAEAYLIKGKKSSYWKMWLKPGWAFLNCYLFRGGFLDGFLGLVIAVNVAHLTFMKYYKLYALQKGIAVRAA